MPIRSHLLESMSSLETVVELINNGTVFHDPEDLAGQYAWDAAVQSGHTMTVDIEAHLDVLSENGAQFDRDDALSVALSFKAEA